MKKNFFLSAVMLALMFLFVSQVLAAKDNPATLAVRGNAILNVPADRLNMDIGVTASAREADAALDEASRKLNGIIKVFEKAGLTKKEYETRRFEVRPQWSSRPKSADRDWRPEIVGFSASTSLSIKTLKLDLGGNLIAAAVEAGANDIGSIYFDLSDPQKYRDQAIWEAAANAQADAQSLARAVGVEILRILSLDLDHSQPVPVRMDYERGAILKTMAGAEAPPLVAGDVSVQASLTMVCEIEEKK